MGIENGTKGHSNENKLIQPGAYSERLPRGGAGEEFRPEGGQGKKIFDFFLADASLGHFSTILDFGAWRKRGAPPPFRFPKGGGRPHEYDTGFNISVEDNNIEGVHKIYVLFLLYGI